MTDDMIGPEPPPPVARVRADQLDRADQVWRARVAGATWKQAAQVGGYSSAANACRSVKQVYGGLPEVDREDLRKLWRDRLERLWQQALRDVEDRRSGAITAAVRVEQAAVALDGLDAPIRFSTTPSDRELEIWVANVVALSRPATLELEEADIFADD